MTSYKLLLVQSDTAISPDGSFMKRLIAQVAPDLYSLHGQLRHSENQHTINLRCQTGQTGWTQQ